MLSIETSSGSIQILNSDIGIANLKSSSGSILLKLKEQKGDLALENVSGAVQLEISKLNSHLFVESVSGTISLNEGDKDLTAEKIMGDGQYKTSIKTVYGSIDIIE